jgi:phage gp36-like protein
VRNALAPGASEDTDTAASFDDAQLNDAIKEADSVVDTYVYSLYSIPMDPDATPPSSVAVYPVRAWSRDIAAYLATLTFRKSKDMLPDDPVRLRYLYVMEILQKIADGSLRPNLPPPASDVNTGQGVFVYNLYPGRLFTAADVFLPPSKHRGYPDWYGWNFRYGDIALSLLGTGYNEVLVLHVGDPIPPGTPDDTLIIFIPEGS